MPIDYQPDRPNHIVRITATGTVTHADIVDLLHLLAEDVPYRLHELNDYRDATMVLSNEELRDLARINSSIYTEVRNLRIAVVLPAGLQHGIARMFAGHMDASAEFNITQDFAAAEAWVLEAAQQEDTNHPEP